MAGAEPQAWGMGLMNTTIFVGLDVHKATVVWPSRKDCVAARYANWGHFRTAPIRSPRWRKGLPRAGGG